MTLSRAAKILSHFVRKEASWFSGLLILGVGFGIVAIYYFGTPSVKNVTDYPFKQTTILYDRSGTHELYRLFDEENRIVIPHSAIPDTIRLATIASEDANFYSHHGIDPLAIIRAIKINVSKGDIEQGASTITQQLARTLFLTRDRTFDRKIKEAFLAIKIDSHVSKEKILDLYLNAVPYGSNAYGIEAAAETFFHKKAYDLTLDESALLSVLPNAPSRLSPYGNFRSELRSRQIDVLQKMQRFGFITDQKFKIAIATDIFEKIKPLERPIFAPHFVFYVLDALKKQYDSERLQTEGWKILTTLDYDLQQAAELAVEHGAAKNISRGASNAALVALDPQSGEVLAMVGSKNYFDTRIDGNVNVTTSPRQPGSAFKPFAYATAFEKGYQPETPIFDTPINFGPDGSGRNYIPRNYDGRFHGLLTMRQALAMSLNVPAVQTLALAGIDDTIKLATRLGITTLTDPKRYGLALVLGGAEVKPIEMANAFSVFSQEGIRYAINPIKKIISQKDGDFLSEKISQGTRVLDVDIARKINSILSDNAARTPIFGSNSPLAFPSGIAVAAKTGTTQNFRDAWTVGYTPAITTAVWAGNNDNRPMHAGADGIFVAAPIWREFMNIALQRFPKTGFVPYIASSIQKNIQTINPDNELPGTKTVYLNKKTGREVSPEKAKKLEKKGFLAIQTGFNTPDENNLSDTSGTGMTSLKDVLNFYAHLKNP